MTKEKPRYEKDFYAWIQHAANLIKKRDLTPFTESDWINLEDEVISLGNKHKMRAMKLLANVISFILIIKDKHQVEEEWITASLIINSQSVINAIIEDSPSIKKYLEENLEEIYASSIFLFERIADFDEDNFYEKCPFKLDQLLSSEFVLTIRPIGL